MAINFIPNDPLALTSMPLRQQAPRPERAGGRAGFAWSGNVAEQVYPPGTPGHLFWQCREATLAAVEAWEDLTGAALAQWSAQLPDRLKLAVLPDVSEGLNAYYDGQSLSFFHSTTSGKTTLSGASTDVVSHETGHALLDSIRPDLWNSAFSEISAFHEAFGDCMALLTSLYDRSTRMALLAAAPDLASANFVETLMEDLADGALRMFGDSHPASAPRHALNTFKWQLPTTLKTWGTPADLLSEPHSLGRVFCGCFYDLIRNLFVSPGAGARDEAALLAAARSAGKLLIQGAAKAPENARFFQSVGRAMELEDQQSSGGANRGAIASAFAAHGLALGSDAVMAPRAALSGTPPRLSAEPSAPGVGAAGPAKPTAALAPATRLDLLRRLGGASDARLSVSPLSLGGQQVAKVVHRREVPLDAVSDALKGVVAIVPEPVLVGGVERRAVLLGALPEPNTTQDEVNKFVETLLRHGDLDLGGNAPRGRAAGPAIAAAAPAGPAGPEGQSGSLPTHAIRVRAGKKVLVRLRFACRPAL